MHLTPLRCNSNVRSPAYSFHTEHYCDDHLAVMESISAIETQKVVTNPISGLRFASVAPIKSAAFSNSDEL